MNDTSSSWQSGILSRLGAKSAAVCGHGPNGSKKVSAAAIGLIAALGATGAMGAESKSVTSPVFESIKSAAADSVGIKTGQSGLERKANLAGTAISALLMPEQMIAEAGAEIVAGAIGGGASKSLAIGKHVSEVATTAVGIVYGAPVIGAYLVYQQANRTYDFIEEQREQALNEKLADVSERVARIQREETLRIRMQERTARASLPEAQRQAEQDSMLARARLESDQGICSSFVAARLEIENLVVEQGGEPEQWYATLMHKNGPALEQDLGETQIAAGPSLDVGNAEGAGANNRAMLLAGIQAASAYSQSTMSSAQEKSGLKMR